MLPASTRQLPVQSQTKTRGRASSSILERISRLQPGKVLDVSKMTPTGTQAVIVNRPATSRSTKIMGDTLPIVSSDLEHYLMAIDMLPGGRQRYAADIQAFKSRMAAKTGGAGSPGVTGTSSSALPLVYTSPNSVPHIQYVPTVSGTGMSQPSMTKTSTPGTRAFGSVSPHQYTSGVTGTVAPLQQSQISNGSGIQGLTRVVLAPQNPKVLMPKTSGFGFKLDQMGLIEDEDSEHSEHSEDSEDSYSSSSDSDHDDVIYKSYISDDSDDSDGEFIPN